MDILIRNSSHSGESTTFLRMVKLILIECHNSLDKSAEVLKDASVSNEQNQISDIRVTYSI